MNHQTQCILFDAEKEVTEWKCSTCDYHSRVDMKRGHISTISWGDTTVSHRGGMGNVNVGAIIAQEASETTDEVIQKLFPKMCPPPRG